MLDLDFAFFNLINTDKRGFLYRKTVLDRLAPFLFAPRVKNLIDLPELKSTGCNIVLPLGAGNLKILENEKQKDLFGRTAEILDNKKIKIMAVDRSLKALFPQLSSGFFPVFGDNFIKALAFVMIRDILLHKDPKRLIIVGNTEDFGDLIEAISGYGLPISIQNPHPEKYEVFAYHFLYKKGLAISNSRIKPENWEKDDLVLLLDYDMQELAVTFPGVFFVRLSNKSRGLARELEDSLAGCGIEPVLHNLAPILEAYLIDKAGFCGLNRELNMTNAGGDGNTFLSLQETGDRLNLWQLFLDKGI